MSRWRLIPAGALALLALAFAPVPAHALRITTWNLLNYTDQNSPPPGNTMTPRDGFFQTVFSNLQTDILIVQELKDASAADTFLINVLRAAQPGKHWSGGGVAFVSAAESAVFYDSSLVRITLPSGLADGGPRQVLATLVRPVGYLSNAASFRLYSMHLKAGGPGTPDSATRRVECTNLRNALNLAPAGTNILLGGDSNFYGAYEVGYTRLTESQSNNIGRLKDPYNMPGDWHVISAYAPYYTQCPCLTGCNSTLGFAGGGLDDRFDLMLGSYPLNDGQGLDIVPGGTFAYGNDGQHFNDDVNGNGFNLAVPLAVANALHEASDHLPVICTLQLPSRVVAASALDFGRVVIGAAAQQSLAVGNGVAVPGDGLDYSFVAPAGFTAPGGSFASAAGAAANLHAIGMDASATGAKGGTLALATDDPDSATKNVLLSGTVVRHAVASLDSLSALTSELIDFGALSPGSFRDTSTAIFDPGFDALQAQLSINTGVIAGGAGRFSIVPGFTPALTGASGQRYTLHFDDTGATPDSIYEATLTFGTSDEPLPGAQPAASLVVTLRAEVTGPTSAPPSSGLPLAFAGPRPNPLASQTRFAFDLPQDAHVSLAIYDLAGRRIAELASGLFGAGHHELPWRATDTSGRVSAGLYFARFNTPGLARTVRVVVLP
jgi:exonuclease III